MKTLDNPSESTWPELIKRPRLEVEFLEGTIRSILNRVKLEGDRALADLTLQYDGVRLENMKVSEKEFEEAISSLDVSIKNAIKIAHGNILKFHSQQERQTFYVETMPGVTCWRKSLPIQKVGIYIPGGTAPLFSTVLMLGIPARLAACEEIILCTPPAPDGSVNPAILFAASLSGIKNIFKVGGAQAIAAMAYGTQSIPAVYKIFGPGNQFVTKAKQLVSLDGVAIDMPAGPSEVLVIGDETADASFIAADLLSQAEHGSDSQVVLVSLSESKISEVQQEIKRQLTRLPRKEIASQSLLNSLSIYFSDAGQAIRFVNEYAPEHLIINTKNCDNIAEKISNAGSVFLGPLSPEAIGDYASGTNHTLPTNGFAKAYSGISLESFTKTITFQKLTAEGLRNLGPTVEVLAEGEHLDGHKQAVSIRLKKLK